MISSPAWGASSRVGSTSWSTTPTQGYRGSSRTKANVSGKCPRLCGTTSIMWDYGGHYLCSVHAARMMVKAGKGLIVIISSMGGLKYVFNVPYGVGKAACDRLAVDCAHELGPQGVAYVSLWPGPVRTETITAKIINAPSTSPAQQKVAEMFAKGETTEMSGRCIVALASDPDIMRKTGRVHLTCDLATEYGLSDVDGQLLVQYRSLSFLLSQVPGTSWISHFIPSFIRMPKWMFNFATNKF